MIRAATGGAEPPDGWSSATVGSYVLRWQLSMGGGDLSGTQLPKVFESGASVRKIADFSVVSAHLCLSSRAQFHEAGFMLHNVITLAEAIASGVSRQRAYRKVEKGEWTKPHTGVFLTRTDLLGESMWKAELAAALRFAGDGSLVSHGAAARLHGLEGLDGFPVDVTTYGNRRSPQIHRSNRVDANPTEFDRLPTTSLIRTIFDLAAVCDANVVEQAIESALRGPKSYRPDLWNEALLVELRKHADVAPKSRARFVLRTVLERRSDADRPTGSFPETVLFQALREVGLYALRQPTLEIVDPRRETLERFFPDLVFVNFRLLIEVDSMEAHGSQLALARDLRRQNKLMRGFRVLRFTAVEILENPQRVANEIYNFVRTLTPSESTWNVGGVQVSYSLNKFEVVDASRGRRAS
jgi:very-short-patch-repair endonuclease